jgi:pSer/pThr/pTyr-binding forkhead associated (FHA) protein
MPYLTNILQKQAKTVSLRIKKRTIVGREDVCDLQYNDAGLSREHFIITNATDNFFLKDNDSSNSTFLNGIKLDAEKEYHLSEGDLITASQQKFIFTIKKPKKHSGKCSQCNNDIHTFINNKNMKCPICDGKIIINS